MATRDEAAGTRHRTFGFTAEDNRLIVELSRKWGPVAPLTSTEVLREALRRAARAEGLEPEAKVTKTGKSGR